VLDQYRALLLDRSYRPVRAVGWRRAVVLGLSGRVDVLELYAREIRTPSRTVPLPAVVRVPSWSHKAPQGVALTRRNVLLRDGHTCHYCGATGSGRELTLDHVVPRSRGGRTAWENVVTACGPCNRDKGDRTPDEAGMRLLATPGRPTALQLGRRGMVIGDPPEEWRAWL
jgi:5-methylcytosine-specific restriction endonuclease McrA